MQTNNYSVKELKEILNIKELINVDEEEVFDYLRVSDINNMKLEKVKDNVLFFPIKLDQSWVDDGWIINTVDLQSVIDDVINNNKNYTFLLEKSMLKKVTYKDAKIIVVDNIMKSIDKLFKAQLKKCSYKVIAVTGSVGKTTTAGIIENVVKKKYNTLRIYSDRITPIVLKASIINFLNESIDYIILEMGIYYKDHVEKLADLLHPDIAAITTIGDAHLDMEGLETKDRIAFYKSKIFKYAKHSFINGDDEYLKNLSISDKKLYYNDELICNTKSKDLTKLYPKEYEFEGNNIVVNGKKIKLNFLTYLSVISALIAYRIGILLKIDEDLVIDAINEFTVVEHRLQRKKVFNKEVIFDGDSSFKERIHQLSLNYYDKSYLVIRYYATYAYYKDDFVGIKDYFKNFDKVYLFSGIRFIDELKDAENAVVVDNHDFMKDLDGEIFYHCNDYFYIHDEVLDEYLV